MMYNIQTEIDKLINISEERKKCRKTLFKFLRENCDKIEDPSIRRKVPSYLGDLTDERLYKCAKQVLYKL